MDYAPTPALLSLPPAGPGPAPNYPAFLIPAAAAAANGGGSPALAAAGLAFPVAFRRPPAVAAAWLGPSLGDVYIR